MNDHTVVANEEQQVFQHTSDITEVVITNQLPEYVINYNKFKAYMYYNLQVKWVIVSVNNYFL